MSLAVRVIPCLDVERGRVVKGVNFVDLIDAGDPVAQAGVDKASSAGYCWAGTTLEVATLQFSAVAKGGTTQQAWADPALPTRPAQVKLGGNTNKSFTPDCAETTN